ncbi:hypothetical protein BU17DRAFT_51986 [Hysterangium stoloniferum]|nr:hypothetical protein BU17DRAFT_51986 [Hysterangium stoloniferum]
MKRSYRVFTGAPPATNMVSRGPRELIWQSFSSGSTLPFPAATLEQAEHRISLIYQNIIFANDSDYQSEGDDEVSHNNEITKSHLKDVSTVSGNDSIDCSSAFQETFFTDQSGDGATMLSDASSIGRFPTFSFNLNMLMALSTLSRGDRASSGASSLKVNLLLGVLEVDGPSYVKSKSGARGDSEVALLKLVVGDESGAVCKMTAWSDTAELWGGIQKEPALKRGDIVLFENVLLPGTLKATTRDNDIALHITASPHQKSQAQICYRTLPYSEDDRRFRPDLRLAYSVPAVRKVGEAVKWMERMAGILGDS